MLVLDFLPFEKVEDEFTPKSKIYEKWYQDSRSPGYTKI
jgi:hypothetical protein